MFALEAVPAIALSGHVGTIAKWQASSNGGINWSDLASTANPLPVENLTVGTVYRAIVTNGFCTDISTVAAVTVDALPVGGTAVTLAPVVCSNTSTLILLTNLVGGIHQWQFSTDNWTTTNAVEITDNPLPTGNLTVSTRFRAVVTNGVCDEAYSADVEVTVDAVPFGGMAVAAASLVCSNTGTTITLSGLSGGVQKWQSTTDNWTTTNDIASSATSLVTGNLSVSTAFRAVVTNGVCAVAYSTEALVGTDALSASATFTPIACNGGTSVVTVTAIGSSPPYTGTGEFTVAAGLHTYTVTNANGCTASTTMNVTEPAVLAASANFTAIACNGGSSTVTVSATGGTPPYTGTGDFVATAGTNTFTVTDANGCATSMTVSVPEPPALVAGAGAGQEVTAGSSAIIGGSPTASGGSPGYTYHWSPETGLNNPSLANCTATPASTTLYTVTVTDSKGCTASASVTVVVHPAPPHEPIGPSSRKTPIAFSEIMYAPAPRADTNTLAFLELYNSNPWFHDISGYRIVGEEVQYTFPAGTIIPGGAYLVVAASPQSIRDVCGITNVMGPYTGSLRNSESLQLLDEQGAALLNVPYTDVQPWPVAAIGTGHSIVLANPTYGELDPRAWAISDAVGGSPGRMEILHASPLRDVVINELLAHSETPEVQQFVELYNHSGQTNDLSGCILTDHPTTNKFVIPADTLISPGGFSSFSQAELGFSLNGAGGTVYLIMPDGSRVLDAVQFEAQADGVSLGRWPDGANAFYPMVALTQGTNNSAIRISDIVINELMYKPISGNDDDEYIELYNKGTNVVSLDGWILTAGVNFTFPAGTTLAPDNYLVVARKLTRLLANYPSLNSGNTIGNYSGKLSNDGERVALAMPHVLTCHEHRGRPHHQHHLRCAGRGNLRHWRPLGSMGRGGRQQPGIDRPRGQPSAGAPTGQTAMRRRSPRGSRLKPPASSTMATTTARRSPTRRSACSIRPSVWWTTLRSSPAPTALTWSATPTLRAGWLTGRCKETTTVPAGRTPAMPAATRSTFAPATGSGPATIPAR